MVVKKDIYGSLAVEVIQPRWRLRHNPSGKGKGNRAMFMVRVNILRSFAERYGARPLC